nr:MAG TPA: hypothetical protein [Caudoviricetes sp.]
MRQKRLYINFLRMKSILLILRFLKRVQYSGLGLSRKCLPSLT